MTEAEALTQIAESMQVLEFGVGLIAAVLVLGFFAGLFHD